MDWVEARLEAVRAREEEELEEDEESSSKKEGQASKLKASSSLARANSAPAVPQHQSPREQPVSFFLLFSLPLPPPPHGFNFLPETDRLPVERRDRSLRRNYRRRSPHQCQIHDPQRHPHHPLPQQLHHTQPAGLKRKHVLPSPRPCRQRKTQRRPRRQQARCPSSTHSHSPPTHPSHSLHSRHCPPRQHLQRRPSRSRSPSPCPRALSVGTL